MNKQYEALLEKIKQYNEIFIFRRDNPDANAYGSQLGLKELIKVNFPQINVYACGKNTDYLNPIGRMDDYEKTDLPNGLAIVVDTASTEWIDSPDWTQCKEVVKIDNHPEKEVYGTLNINNQFVSTCSELIANIALDLKWKITSEAAQCLLIGIFEGTTNFLSYSFNKSTFLTMAKLIELTPNVKDIIDRSVYTTENENRLKKYMVDHLKQSSPNTTSVYIPYRILKKYQIDPNRAATFMWLILEFSLTEFTVVFTEYENKKIRVQLNSKIRPVNTFAAKYGGWGTNNSAGAFIDNKKQMNEITKTLDEQVL